jgi:hypothetical protein
MKRTSLVCRSFKANTKPRLALKKSGSRKRPADFLEIKTAGGRDRKEDSNGMQNKHFMNLVLRYLMLIYKLMNAIFRKL